MAACRGGGLTGRLQLSRPVPFHVPHIKGVCPDSRGGHTLTVVSEKALLMFGGFQISEREARGVYFSDMKLLELHGHPADFVWKDPPRAHSDRAPCARANHTATLSHTQQHVILFGGCCRRDASAAPADGDESVLGDCHLLHMHFAGWRWEPLSTEGEPPCPRCGHTAVEWKGAIIVFGGRPTDGQFYNDVHSLELSRRGKPRWARLAPAGAPPGARAHHTAVLLAGGNRMAVYGGITVPSGTALGGAGGTAAEVAQQLGDVWLLSLAPARWERVALDSSPLRSSHVAVALPPTGGDGLSTDELMIVFGGRVGQGRLNLVSVLALAPDTAAGRWSEALTAKEAVGAAEAGGGRGGRDGGAASEPAARAGRASHAMALLAGKLVVVGGYLGSHRHVSTDADFVLVAEVADVLEAARLSPDVAAPRAPRAHPSRHHEQQQQRARALAQAEEEAAATQEVRPAARVRAGGGVLGAGAMPCLRVPATASARGGARAPRSAATVVTAATCVAGATVEAEEVGGQPKRARTTAAFAAAVAGPAGGERSRGAPSQRRSAGAAAAAAAADAGFGACGTDLEDEACLTQSPPASPPLARGGAARPGAVAAGGREGGNNRRPATAADVHASLEAAQAAADTVAELSGALTAARLARDELSAETTRLRAEAEIGEAERATLSARLADERAETQRLAAAVRAAEEAARITRGERERAEDATNRVSGLLRATEARCTELEAELDSARAGGRQLRAEISLHQTALLTEQRARKQACERAGAAEAGAAEARKGLEEARAAIAQLRVRRRAPPLPAFASHRPHSAHARHAQAVWQRSTAHPMAPARPARWAVARGALRCSE